MYASQSVLVKFQVASEEFRVNVGLLQLGGGGVGAATAWWPATPWTACVWRFSWLNIISHVGVASGVVYWHSPTEQIRGVGGGITAVVSLGHFF
jgi:hypothetical protein